MLHLPANPAHLPTCTILALSDAQAARGLLKQLIV